MRKVVLLTLCLCLLAAPAWADLFSVGFGQVQALATVSSTVTPYTPIAGLEISARSVLSFNPADLTAPATTNAITAAVNGLVVKGNLGNMDASPGPFYGLGVHTAAGDGGSAGISGGGPAANEALVFNFGGLGVNANSVVLHLVGLNSTGKNADTIALFLDFIPTGSLNSVLYPVAYSAVSGLGDLAFNSLGLPVGAAFGTFAIESVDGHFGVGGIEGDTIVPIPPTALLLGSGLLGLVGLRWRRRKTDV